MSDNPFDNVPSGDEQEEDPFEEFLSGIESEPALDPAHCVTLRSPNGQSFTVPCAQPTPLSQILADSHLAFQSQCQFWVNNNLMDVTAEVAPGAVITASTVVKGG